MEHELQKSMIGIVDRSNYGGRGTSTCYVEVGMYQTAEYGDGRWSIGTNKM